MAVAAALLVHVGAHLVLYDRDLIQAAVQAETWPLALAAALFLARIFLYFFAPGWALYLVIRSGLDARAARARSSLPS